jgi:hypothetical protein
MTDTVPPPPGDAASIALSRTPCYGFQACALFTFVQSYGELHVGEFEVRQSSRKVFRGRSSHNSQDL